jgi:hypothetical protein
MTRRIVLASLLAALVAILSGATSVAAAAGSPATFGKTSVGGSLRYASPNYRLASIFALDRQMSVTSISARLAGRGTSGEQVVRAVIYADTDTGPGALLASSAERSIRYDAPGEWVEFPLPSQVGLAPGQYWLGIHAGPASGDALINFSFDAGPGAQRTKSDLFSDGPSATFGTGSVQDREMSIFAVGEVESAGVAPVNVSPPTISGSAASGATLHGSEGDWSGAPTSFAFTWLRCFDGSCTVLPTTAPDLLLGADDVGASIVLEVAATNSAGTSTARSAGTAIVTGVDSDGLTQVAGELTGSSDPTYFASNRRLAVTRSGRLLAVYGKHASGVQLAWRDPGAGWRTETSGAVSSGLLLGGTGTGDWPASIAVATDASGNESAWVVWSRATFGSNRPVQLRRLSDLDAPGGPRVGPIVTIDAPSLGAARADLAFEQQPDGSSKGFVVWTRRVSENDSEVVGAWFEALELDAPPLTFTTIVAAGSGARTATLAPTPAGLRLVTRTSSARLRLFGHDPGSDGWWAGAQGVSVTSSSRPTAVASDAGDVIVAVESDTTAGLSVVQRLTRTSVVDEVSLSGYGMPSLATDGVSVWMVAVRKSDGFVVSRRRGPDSAWEGTDRVEIGAEGGGGYAWPNLLRQVDGRLRLIVQGPAGDASRTSVLAYQRSVSP